MTGGSFGGHYELADKMALGLRDEPADVECALLSHRSGESR